MENNYIEAVEKLKKYHQDHIIGFINNADLETKNKLVAQVLSIDFEELNELYNKTFEDLYVDLEELHPVAGINPCKLSTEKLEEFKKIGSEIIKSNKFAVSTMAGGQGTRLRSS